MSEKQSPRYKRNREKHRLSIEDFAQCFDERISSDPNLNHEAKQRLIPDNNKLINADKVSKAITHFAFRNGPVEGMHSKGQLSEDDMMTLNKFMVNRLAYLLNLIFQEKWLEFELFITMYRLSGSRWDPAEPDDGGMKSVMIEALYLKYYGEKTFLL